MVPFLFRIWGTARLSIKFNFFVWWKTRVLVCSLWRIWGNGVKNSGLKMKNKTSAQIFVKIFCVRKEQTVKRTGPKEERVNRKHTTNTLAATATNPPTGRPGQNKPTLEMVKKVNIWHKFLIFASAGGARTGRSEWAAIGNSSVGLGRI